VPAQQSGGAFVPAVPPPVEQPSVSVVGLATWEARAYASAIDLSIYGGLLTVYSMVVGTVHPVLTVAVWLSGWFGGDVGTPITWGYWGIGAAWLLWQWSVRGRTGQSLSQRLVGIAVVDEETRHAIGPARSVLRSLTHLLDLAPAALGLLRPTWDRRRQTWADKVHHTLVISVPTARGPVA